MKSVVFSVILLASSSAFAISDSALIAACFSRGVERVVSQAKEWGCFVDASQIQATEVDNRFWNPSKYIWYTSPAPCNGFSELTKMVQYYKGACI